MILGELFYYNKKLDEITFPIAQDKIKSVELMGIKSNDLNIVGSPSNDEINRFLRDKFTTNYLLILEESELEFAFIFWEGLISPLKKLPVQTESKLTPKSVFQQQLLAWAGNNFHINLLPDLLNNAQYATSEIDFALYYGLKVISKFSPDRPTKNNYTIKSEVNINQNPQKLGLNISSNPQIIVLTQDYLSPLFTNINCVYLPLSKDSRHTLESIEKSLLENPDIKIILVNSVDVELLNFLKKYVPSDLIVAQFDLNQNESVSFFDKIAKKTLGIKLTTD